jgi:hypothetical protein
MKQIQTTRSFAMILCASVGVAISQAAGPVFYGFSPSAGKIGSVVTLNGAGFDQVTEVDFTNGRVATFQHVNSTTLKATVPNNSYLGQITLKFAGGKVLSPYNFNVTDGFVPPPNLVPPAGALTGHPRIFLNSADVNKYRSWSVNINPIWVSLKQAAVQAKADMDAHHVPDLDNGDGNGNYTQYPSESYAELFAFMALVDPNAANRADYAQRAHDLLMYVINIADLGVGSNSDKFRMPKFSVFNRSRWYGEAFPIVVDWVYSTFTTAEKATIRKVFLRWIQENIVADVTSAEHPQPVGTVNSTAITASATRNRWASNNYYCNHARQVGMLAMALDDTDDIPSKASDPKSGSLRKFVGNAIGAWLYMVKKCEETATAGGISPEGSGYGESDTSGIAMLLLAMRSTGVDDASVYGPAADLAKGQFWSHDFLDAYIHSMSPKTVIQESWIGPIHLPADFGDTGKYSIVNYIRTLGPIALLARSSGDQAVYNKARWMIDEFEPGIGYSRGYQLSSCMNNYGPMLPILYFMVCDPSEPKATDPRPNMPIDFFGTGLNRILSRTDWTPNASWFAFKCGWNSTDHNSEDGNKIEFYRKGEWLFKDRTGYGFNVGLSEFKNTLAIENPSPINSFWGLQGKRGSQLSYNVDGSPTTTHSFNADYVYVNGVATSLYNNSYAKATDVTHASRSVLWLKPDILVVFDRATTATASRFKRFFLNTSTLATVNGKVATMTTPNGQHLFVKSILPAGSVITAQNLPPNVNGPDANETAQGEFMLNRIMIEDPAKPKDVRFLTVLQGADAGATPISTSLITSTQGATLQGTTVGNVVVMFYKNSSALKTTSTFTIPTGTTKTYVTGLVPSTNYTVTQTPVAGGTQITISIGGGLTSDAGGVLVF